jgi:hypothetical protein
MTTAEFPSVEEAIVVRCPSEALDNWNGVDAVMPGPAAFAVGAISMVSINVKDVLEIKIFKAVLNTLFIGFLFSEG